jgi:small subunit ribosomal protein S2
MSVATVSLKTLLEAGVHFGHQTRRWNPKMKPFIFTEKNGIHIIDLAQTNQRMRAVTDFIRDVVARNETILFVGTKKQAQEAVETEARRCAMPYVNQRWLGGMLTNFRTTRSRIQRMHELEEQKQRNELDRFSKKEGQKLDDELTKLHRLLGGMRELNRMPTVVFIVDTRKERIAMSEATRLDLPIIGIVDTNCDPDEVTLPIPGNDDAIRSVKLLTSLVADAVIEARSLVESARAEEKEQAAPAEAIPEPVAV